MRSGGGLRNSRQDMNTDGQDFAGRWVVKKKDPYFACRLMYGFKVEEQRVLPVLQFRADQIGSSHSS